MCHDEYKEKQNERDGRNVDKGCKKDAGKINLKETLKTRERENI